MTFFHNSAHIFGQSDRMFMKILPQMYIRQGSQTQRPYTVSLSELRIRTLESEPDSPWRRSALVVTCSSCLLGSTCTMLTINKRQYLCTRLGFTGTPASIRWLTLLKREYNTRTLNKVRQAFFVFAHNHACSLSRDFSRCLDTFIRKSLGTYIPRVLVLSFIGFDFEQVVLYLSVTVGLLQGLYTPLCT